MIYKIFRYSNLSLVLLLCLSTTVWSQANPDAGKSLFQNNCAACHAKDMKTKSTGPALAGAQERWANDADLYAWIRNSQAMIAKGHPIATELWKTWGPTVMTAFPNLTDAQIGDVLAYINGTADGSYGKPAGAPVATGIPVDTKPKGISWVWWVLLGVLVVMAAILSRLIGGLNRLAKIQAGEAVEESRSLWQFLSSKGMVTTLIVLGVVLAGYTTVINGIGCGRQQNDQPY